MQHLRVRGFVDVDLAKDGGCGHAYDNLFLPLLDRRVQLKLWKLAVESRHLAVWPSFDHLRQVVLQVR